MDEVRRLEKAEPDERLSSERSLAFAADVMGIPANIVYTFKDCRLVQASYAFRAVYANPETYLTDYRAPANT